MQQKNNSILVTGDVLVDHHIYVGERSSPYSTNYLGTHEKISEGGAGLVYRFLVSIAQYRAKNLDDQSVYKVDFGFDSKVFKKVNSSLHAFAIWKPFQYENFKVWRLDKSLGYGNKSTLLFSYADYINQQLFSYPQILVIDDAGLGFRHYTQKNAWPKVMFETKNDKLNWIVLKMASPIAQGNLWWHLGCLYREKLIVVISIEDIRSEEVQVSRGVSWERTAINLAEELCFNPAIQGLLSSRHLIITFGTEGALHFENLGEDKRFELIFDPEHLEYESSEKIEGSGLRLDACFTACIVDCLAQSNNSDNITNGIKAGLSSMQVMHIQGHGSVENEFPDFAYNYIVQDIISPTKRFSEILLPDPYKTDTNFRKSWMIMTASFKGISKNPSPLYGIGRRVALLGTNALNNIPFASFGKLFTVDRNEIENLRNIRTMILNYVMDNKKEKPLSLAVFGPPGAGKSFGICEIAIGILGKDVPILVFNLSQFEGPSGLIGALHQVRDKVLAGIMPIVFWDEFDSKEYFWLQYMLAPMQEGKFLEGQITHSIGKCVFVFAGGTSYNMENFGPLKKDVDKWELFKLKKGPDFISRLSGFLNVLGPNRRLSMNSTTGEWEEDPNDLCFPVRRALLLRMMIGLKDNDRIVIDPGILSALIEISRYKHGARSLEKIIQLLKKTGFIIHRSDLPPEDIISLHTDAEEFLNIINRDLNFKTNAEVLAPFIHDFYRRMGIAEKWIRDDMNLEYNDLIDEYKEDNRAAARRLPLVLSLLGLYVVPESYTASNSNEDICELMELNIELLAEAEHNGWMEHKVRNGWLYYSDRDDTRKVHNCLKPYHELSEKEKDNDRNSVRNFPQIIKEAKYKIVSSLREK